MKKKYLNGEEVNIVKELSVKDKLGQWVQVGMITGKERGMRRPVLLDELVDVSEKNKKVEKS